MNIIEKYPFLQSSADPERLSMTIKGILTAVVVSLSFVGVIPVDAIKDVAPLADTVVTGVQGILAGVAAVLTMYGALRKAYYKWFA